jgi:phosphotransferase system  glucose/maltose/N-acetylglucosamine-specific IIC component
MACSLTCGLAAAFVIAMVLMNYWMITNQTTQKYKAQLPSSLQKTYDEIVKERTQIFYTGYIIGVLLAARLIYYNTQIKKEKMGTCAMVCLTIFVAFITNYFYYTLSPKTKWMLNSIEDPEQTKAWLQMYRTMQLYYHGSLVLGLIAVGVLAFAFRI